ncbi:MAG TPA: hypothetical protein VLE46_06685, partial [Nitrospira sp.]|nr:hypothetical protein [Nitrospira sp.]
MSPTRKATTKSGSPQKADAVPRCFTESIGRVGELRLEYAKSQHRTIIAHSYFTTPWKLLPPIYLD